MRRPRFQFRLSTAIWISLIVCAFFGGAELQRIRMERYVLRDVIELERKVRAENRRQRLETESFKQAAKRLNDRAAYPRTASE